MLLLMPNQQYQNIEGTTMQQKAKTVKMTDMADMHYQGFTFLVLADPGSRGQNPEEL